MRPKQRLLLFGQGATVRPPYYGIYSAGQSLAAGGSATAITTTQLYDNVKLLVGAASLSIMAGGNERPLYGASNWLRSQNSTYKVLGIPHAQGGISIASLNKGGSSGNFEDGLASLAVAVSETERIGADPLVIYILDWIHGEQDTNIGTNPATYKSLLGTLISDYDTDTKAVTSQAETIQCVLSQVSSNFELTGTHTISLAQWEYARDTAGTFMVGPKYQLEYDVGVHLSATGYEQLGAYHGKVWKNILDGDENWLPMYPTSAVRSGAVITVTFNVPVGELTLDTTLVASATNSGIVWADAGDGNSVSISSAVKASATTMTVTLDGTPTGTGQKLQFGLEGDYSTGYGYDSTTQPRTNIRDQNSTASLYGNNLYNWCIHCEIDVTI